MRLRAIAVLPVALAFALGACGGDDDSNAGSTTTTQSTASQPAGAGETVDVTMSNFAFDPAEVTIKAGQTVKWTNKDSAPHNVVGGPLKSDTFERGGTFSYTFKKAGTYDYVCTIHPQMKAKVIVQ